VKKNLKKVKTDKLGSIGKQSREFLESLLEKKNEGYGGKDLQKKEGFSLE